MRWSCRCGRDLLRATYRKHLYWLFRQLAWALATEIEASVLGDCAMVSAEPAARVETVAGNRFALGAFAQRDAKSRQQRWDDVHEALLAYHYGCHQHFAKEIRHISCAFDASRVGGLGRMLGVILDGNVLAWAPPLVAYISLGHCRHNLEGSMIPSVLIGFVV